MSYDEKTDGDLLALFLKEHAQPPFEALMKRHGKLVYGLCSRILGATHDAEDATQAVFMTLAHKAASLTNHPSIAGWLHRTAFNVATRTREARARRSSREREVAAMTADHHSPDQSREEWSLIAPLLDTELDALPEKFRLPIILHYIEGRSQSEVATLLGCTYGVISGRLNRAREILRQRLSRRGVLLSSALIVSLISQNASAEVPVSIAATTAKAATLIAAGNAAAPGLISAQAAALTQGALKIMFIKKVKLAAAAVFAATVLCGIIGIAAYTALASETPPVAPVAPPAAENPPVAPAVPVPTANELAGWIRELEFKDTRVAAADKLRAAGDAARAALEKASNGDNAEAREIAGTLLKSAKVTPTLESLQAKVKVIMTVEADVAVQTIMGGLTMSGTGSIKAQIDKKQWSAEVAMSFGGMQMPSKTVCDGAIIWTEMTMPTLGDKTTKMVTKRSASSEARDEEKEQFNPLVTEHYRKQFDFTEMKEDVLAGKAVYIFSGKTRLGYVEEQEKRGHEIGGEQFAKMSRDTAEAVASGRLVIGKDDGVVYKIEMLDAKGTAVQSVTYSNVKTSVTFADSAQFAYTPPTDIKVIDADVELKKMKDVEVPAAAPADIKKDF
jgi:RNA polymerase sigma factor (sigma-70 family)